MWDRPDLVVALIESGADPDKCGALGVACEMGKTGIAEKLISLGADVNANAGYHTPLSASCLWGQVDSVRILLAHGAKVNLFPRQCHSSALHWAFLAPENRDAIIRLLLEAGADPYAKDGDGRSSIDAIMGDPSLTQVLKEVSASRPARGFNQ
jgi:ankyrin repeat protein